MVRIGKRTSVLYLPQLKELRGTIEREWVPELQSVAQMLKCPLDLQDVEETQSREYPKGKAAKT
jgi:hypothetical protein